MRRLVFSALLAALLIAAFLAGSDHRQSTAAPRVGPTRQPGDLATTSRPARRARLRPVAQRFILAFLAYGAGERPGATETTIRRTASRRLSTRLLAGPTGSRARVIIGAPARPTLEIARLPHRPGLALVTGTAERAAGPEPFAFLFARRSGRWLAIAPAE